MNTTLLQTAGEGQGTAQLLFFGLIFVVMYFFMILLKWQENNLVC